jgi:hypothetical protein
VYKADGDKDEHERSSRTLNDELQTVRDMLQERTAALEREKGKLNSPIVGVRLADQCVKRITPNYETNTISSNAILPL